MGIRDGTPSQCLEGMAAGSGQEMSTDLCQSRVGWRGRMVNKYKALVWQVQVQQDREAAAGNRVPVPSSQHEDGDGKDHWAMTTMQTSWANERCAGFGPSAPGLSREEFFPFSSPSRSYPPSVISFLPIF